jgi:hypothetical protein
VENVNTFMVVAMLDGSLVSTAWCILKLQMKDSLELWRVAADALNTQLCTNDKGLSSSLGVGHEASNSAL